MPGEWQVLLHFISEHFKSLDEQLNAIRQDAQDSAAYSMESRKRLEYLNSWHEKVTGALWVISGLAGGAFAVGLVVLKTVLGV